MKIAMAILTVLLIGIAAVVVPIQPYQDFQVLYHADMGLLRGIPLYDQPGQVEMIAEIAGVAPSQVYVLPFPYPPWYALSTVWLALLPVETAARLWFGLNLLLFLASIGLLTRGQAALKRGLLLCAAIFWMPALGSLLVGQFGFPVLFGAALMVTALQRENPVLFVLAAVLMSLKPHLGAPIILLSMAALLVRRERFRRGALIGLVAAGAILLGSGFLASPLWPSAYVRSLLSFQQVHGVADCTQCVSLPVVLSTTTGGGLGRAAWIALALVIIVAASLAWKWRTTPARALGIVATGAAATLLVSPYLLNYDYVLLLIPWMALAVEAHSTSKWIALGTAYFLPAAALAIWGTGGNPALVASTLIVSAMTIGRRAAAGSEGVASALA